MIRRCLLALGLMFGCVEYDCEQDSPALDVVVRIGALEAAPASLDLTAELSGERYARQFDVAGALQDGETSLRIRLGELGEQPVDVLLIARAFSGPDGSGDMLAETTHVVAASPDACNEVVIDLFPQRLVCNATCTADCRGAELCPVQCAANARCAVDCIDAQSCQVTCDPGSSCSVDCSGASDCTQVRCGAEASCALYCGPQSPCAFAECAGVVRTCDDGTIVCNGFCT